MFKQNSDPDEVMVTKATRSKKVKTTDRMEQIPAQSNTVPCILPN